MKVENRESDLKIFFFKSYSRAIYGLLLRIVYIEFDSTMEFDAQIVGTRHFFVLNEPVDIVISFMLLS